MDEAAVLDAPVEASIEETPVETAPDTLGAVETPAEETPAPVAADVPAIENGRLSAPAKEYLDKLKTENPALEKQFRNALYAHAQYQKELPGGLKELQAMRSLVEERGGADGLREMAERLGSFEEFDKTYFAGDPRALEHMTATPEGKDALVRLMPAALDKFQQISPDGYTSHMAGLFAATMDSWRVPVALELLNYLVADNPRAVEQLQKIQGFYGQMLELSQKKPEAPKPQQQTAQPDKRASELDEREAKLVRDEWGRESAQEQQAAFETTFKELCGGRNVPPSQVMAIAELFETKFNKGLQEKSDVGNLTHEQVLERYRVAKDKAGFMKYAAELNRTLVPKKLKLAVEQVLPTKPGPKPPVPPGGKPLTPPVNGKAAQGFTQVSKPPLSDEIDYRHSFNSAANWQAGKAVLKSGQMVQWKR